MSTATEAFFKQYATAYDEQDTETLVGMYMIPAVIMTDDKKQVCTKTSEVSDYIEDLIDKLQQGGVRRHQAELTQCMRLSEKILFANVLWGFFDSENNKLFSCHVSYTLQQSQDEEIKIIIAVLDDEEQALENLLHG